MSSDPDLGRPQRRNRPVDEFGIDFSKTCRDDCRPYVYSGVVPVDESFLWVEVDKEVGVITDGCIGTDFDGGLLLL